MNFEKTNTAQLNFDDEILITFQEPEQDDLFVLDFTEEDIDSKVEQELAGLKAILNLK